MVGQMTYDEKTKSWKFHTINQMTGLIAGTGKSKIQSREGYYKAWKNGNTNHSASLTEMIVWIQG